MRKYAFLIIIYGILTYNRFYISKKGKYLTFFYDSLNNFKG